MLKFCPLLKASHGLTQRIEVTKKQKCNKANPNVSSVSDDALFRANDSDSIMNYINEKNRTLG